MASNRYAVLLEAYSGSARDAATEWLVPARIRLLWGAFCVASVGVFSVNSFTKARLSRASATNTAPRAVPNTVDLALIIQPTSATVQSPSVVSNVDFGGIIFDPAASLWLVIYCGDPNLFPHATATLIYELV